MKNIYYVKNYAMGNFLKKKIKILPIFVFPIDIMKFSFVLTFENVNFIIDNHFRYILCKKHL